MNYSFPRPTAMKYPFLISCGIHVILLFILFSLSSELPGQQGGKGNSKDQGNNGVGQATEGTIMAKPDPIPIEIVEIPPKDGLTKKKLKHKTKYADHDCKGHKSYGGIGVTIMPVYASEETYSQQIVEVFDNYPAAKAGLLAGDIVQDDKVEIMGTPGTEVKVCILRKGMLMTFTLIREKICLEEKL